VGRGAGAVTVTQFLGRVRIDWVLFGALIPVLGAGLVTMESFGSGGDYFFLRQLIWALVSVAAFFLVSAMDWSFLKRSGVLVALFVGMVAILAALFGLARSVRGCRAGSPSAASRSSRRTLPNSC